MFRRKRSHVLPGVELGKHDAHLRQWNPTDVLVSFHEVLAFPRGNARAQCHRKFLLQLLHDGRADGARLLVEVHDTDTWVEGQPWPDRPSETELSYCL